MTSIPGLSILVFSLNLFLGLYATIPFENRDVLEPLLFNIFFDNSMLESKGRMIKFSLLID